MKVALLFRGPIRPNKEYILENLLFYKEVSFKNLKAEITTFLVSDLDNQNDIEIINYFDNVIKVKRFDNSKIDSLIGRSFLPNQYNTFNQFYQSKIAIDLIDSLQEFDFIVHARTDSKIDISGFESEWFQPNSYQTIHVLEEGKGFNNDTSFTNDQFSIAQPHIMKSMWDYGNYSILSFLFRSSLFAENVLNIISKQKDIKTKACSYNYWELKNIVLEDKRKA